jgi:uncharacterized membrane-anchored protein YhcB (DUF1043 family)
MDFTSLIVGVIVGLIVGLIVLWFVDRRHRRTTRKLIDSRRKIERQRTQAVNDLFALRAEVEEGRVYTSEQTAVGVGSEPDPQMVAELANLRSLIARADGALTAARRKRDQNEAEIGRLYALLEEAKGENVIELRRDNRPGQSNLAL